jgi:urease accessory protein
MRVVTFHRGEDPALAQDSVELDAEGRHLRRKLLITRSGAELHVDFAHAAHLVEGDQLVRDDGGRVLVKAAAEPLMEVRGRDAAHLLQLAWHIGNRHLAAQISPQHLRIRHDAVIATMLEQLGATVSAITAPFEPEHGAYHGHAH